MSFTAHDVTVAHTIHAWHVDSASAASSAYVIIPSAVNRAAYTATAAAAINSELSPSDLTRVSRPPPLTHGLQ